MDASTIFSHVPVCSTSSLNCLSPSVATVNFSLSPSSRRANNSTRNHRICRRISTVGDISAVTSDPVHVEVTWQIVVGALAGVSPFVVAGIEFSKRIVAQKKCEVCGGSRLVMREKNYFRCPGCGGFLPWQSWKRFFSG